MILKQLYNPLSNKFDLVRSSGAQTRVIPVTVDMTTAQFRMEGTNLQWIVEAYANENGIYTPAIISYSKSINGNYTVIDFSWNTAFSGEIHVTYGVGKFVQQVNLPDYYYRYFKGEKLVYPLDGGTDFNIYAVMPINCKSMFYYCDRLVTIPPTIDTSKAETMFCMFYGCTALKSIPKLNVSRVGSPFNMMEIFTGCSSLENCQLLNLRTDISFVQSPLLSFDSVQFMVKNSWSANNPTNMNSLTMTLHPDTLAKVQADTTVYEWNGQSYTGLIALATAMQITIQ